MKRRAWLMVALVLLGGLITFLSFAPAPSPSARRAMDNLEATRDLLRQQGFKTDLAEFDFSVSLEVQRRSAAVVSATMPFSDGPVGSAIPSICDPDELIWSAAWIEGRSTNSRWQGARALLDDYRQGLDVLCQVVLSGPIHFQPTPPRLLMRGYHLVQMLPNVLRVSHLLSCRAFKELEDHNGTAAFTNLLAVTRLATAWNTGPYEFAHYFRASCASVAQRTTREAILYGSLTDEHLAGLQREWQSLDFLGKVSHNIALSRCVASAQCRFDRSMSQPSRFDSRTALREFGRSPLMGWQYFKSFLAMKRHLDSGKYDVERAMLLSTRDEEHLRRRATESGSWAQMKTILGITNARPPGALAFYALSAPTVASPASGRTLLERLSEAEAMRRLAITALALERFRVRSGSFPATLDQLVGQFLKEPLMDFADGKPLRYRATEDGGFLLYSVGLDCEDNLGFTQPLQLAKTHKPTQTVVGTDLVWRRPGTIAR